MSYIPLEDLKERHSINLAPMVDFLFLMLAIFACFALSHSALRDTELELVQSRIQSASSIDERHDFKLINLSVLADGHYTWMTEIKDHPMQTPQDIADELLRQYDKGLLPSDKLKTQILLRIDRQARWEPILELLLAVRETGFEVRPVYEPLQEPSS